MLENYIATWGKARGILPEPVVKARAESGLLGMNAASDARAFIESQSQAPALSLSHPALFPDPTREAMLPPETKRVRKVVRIEKVQGIGGWYDEALATGQYRPSFGRRVALAVVRSLFPDSEPTQVITYDDGTVEIILGGGPTSGAMGGQVAVGSGIVAAAAKGKLLKEAVESVIDTAFQEATGLPVPAPPLARRKRGKGRKPRPRQRQIKDVRQRPVAEANAEHTAKGYEPPYHPNANVRDFTTESELRFVRVYADKNRQSGGWMVRADAIEGMSPAEIKQAPGLKTVPKYITDVLVPKDTRMRMSIVASQPQWKVPHRGVVQYELLDEIPESSFTNARPL